MNILTKQTTWSTVPNAIRQGNAGMNYREKFMYCFCNSCGDYFCLYDRFHFFLRSWHGISFPKSRIWFSRQCICTPAVVCYGRPPIGKIIWFYTMWGYGERNPHQDAAVEKPPVGAVSYTKANLALNYRPLCPGSFLPNFLRRIFR